MRCGHVDCVMTLWGTFYRATVVARLTYAVSACGVRGLTKAPDCKWIDSVLNRARHHGYYSPDQPMFDELCNTADDELFGRAMRLSNHVLHALRSGFSTANYGEESHITVNTGHLSLKVAPTTLATLHRNVNYYRLALTAVSNSASRHCAVSGFSNNSLGQKLEKKISCDLELALMTMTYEIDLGRVTMNHHTKYLSQRSFRRSILAF